MTHGLYLLRHYFLSLGIIFSARKESGNFRERFSSQWTAIPNSKIVLNLEWLHDSLIQRNILWLR